METILNLIFGFVALATIYLMIVCAIKAYKSI